MVVSDVPINNKDDDLLNRNRFAEKLAESILEYKSKNPLTIGLIGDWGSGKTSIINLFLDSMDKKLNQNTFCNTKHKRVKYKKITFKKIKCSEYIIINFNPWFFSNQSNLYVQFFKVLINNITNHEYNKIPLLERTTDYQKSLFKKLRIETLEEYLNYLELNKSLPMNNETYLIDSNKIESFDSLLSHKKLCDDYFNSLDYKIVVIIDDIDRLNPDEIKQIFQLVKSLADFPNLIYILAFDKNYVNYALKEWNREDDIYPAGDFIDKIVQVPLKIPKFDDNDLFNVFKLKFDHVLSNHKNIDVAGFNISKLWLWTAPFFKNIRDINRYCNAIDFYLYSVDKEVWIHDFALITALQIFEEEIYDEVKYNKDLLTDDFNLFMGLEDIKKPREDDLNCFLKSIFNNKNLKHEAVVKNILSDLFPKVKYILFSSYTSDYELSLKREKCGIMGEEYFDLYFSFDNTNKLSKSRIDLIINSANNNVETLKVSLLKIKKIGLLDSLIDQLSYHVDKFDSKGIENLINVFINHYEKLFIDEPFNSINSKIEKAINLIYYLVKGSNFEDDHFVDTVTKSENNYFKTYLIWQIYTSDLLYNESNLKLKQDISEFLSDYFEKTEFSKIEYVRSYIGFWRDLSNFETTNEYVIKLNDDDLIMLVNEFKEYNSAREEYFMEYDYLSHIVELNSIKKRIEKIKLNEEFYNENKFIIDLFLENFPNK